MVWLELAVVILAIVMGVRMGGIGLGLWGVAGVAVLVFVFGLHRLAARFRDAHHHCRHHRGRRYAGRRRHRLSRSSRHQR